MVRSWCLALVFPGLIASSLGACADAARPPSEVGLDAGSTAMVIGDPLPPGGGSASPATRDDGGQALHCASMPPQTLETTLLRSRSEDAWIRLGLDGAVLARHPDGELFLADAAIHKLTRQGEPIWCARLPGAARALVALPNGGALVAGEEIPFGCGDAIKLCMRGYLAEFDAEGALRRTLRFNSAGSASRVSGLASSDGRIFAAGQFRGDLELAGRRVASAADHDHFVLALDAETWELAWAEAMPSPGDDPDGPVLAPHPLAGVVAAGHMHDASFAFIRGYDAAGEVQFEFPLHGDASVFMLTIDGAGSIWAAGVLRGALLLGDPPKEHRLVTRGEFDAFVLELDPDGELLEQLQFTTPTDGGVRVLGLAPRSSGVWLIHDYGYPSAFDDLKQVVARFGVIAGGEYVELDAYALVASFSRQSSVSELDDALVWAARNSTPTSFGLDQGEFPSSSFLMRRAFDGAGAN